LSANSEGDAGQTGLSGYAKSFLIRQEQQDSEYWTLATPFCLKMSYLPAEDVSFNLAYVISYHWNNPGIVYSNGSSRPSQYRFKDFDQRLWPEAADEPKQNSFWHNLDRAYIRLSRNWADIFLGRQPVAWGSGRLVSPTDIVAPYPFNELDNEERVGVDAVRAVVPLGSRSEIMTGYVAGDGGDINKSVMFLRSRVNLLKTDIAFTLARFSRNALIGMDVAGAIGGAGVWLEAGAMRYGVFPNDRVDSPDILRLSTGSDFRFSDKLYASMEYHLSTAGETRPGRYNLNYFKDCYAEGQVYLMGRHYLALSIMYQITPLLSATTMPLVNLNDRSFVYTQRFEYNLTQNSYFTLGVYWGVGKDDVMEGSEFGRYANTVFLSYGIYF